MILLPHLLSIWDYKPAPPRPRESLTFEIGALPIFYLDNSLALLHLSCARGHCLPRCRPCPLPGIFGKPDPQWVQVARQSQQACRNISLPLDTERRVTSRWQQRASLNGSNTWGGGGPINNQPFHQQPLGDRARLNKGTLWVQRGTLLLPASLCLDPASP